MERGGEREGGGEKNLRNTFQRLRPEDFSSRDSAGDFGLRSFCMREQSGGSYNHYTRREQLPGADRKRLKICFKIIF